MSCRASSSPRHLAVPKLAYSIDITFERRIFQRIHSGWVHYLVLAACRSSSFSGRFSCIWRKTRSFSSVTSSPSSHFCSLQNVYTLRKYQQHKRDVGQGLQGNGLLTRNLAILIAPYSSFFLFGPICLLRVFRESFLNLTMGLKSCCL